MKSKTHVYMANMIIEDLKKGKENAKVLFIPDLRGFYPPKEIVDAILNKPNAFRAGSFGPDFYPDMIVGQALMHPAQSGEWLKLMFKQFSLTSADDPERQSILSFLCGFMLHYSGDMFGHNYVNGYAGGWFPDITEAITEATNKAAPDTRKAKIIARHMMIESYMDLRVPKKENMTLEAPINFLVEVFTSPGAMKLYSKCTLPTVPIQLMVKLRNTVVDIANSSTAGTIDIFGYTDGWLKDVNNAITRWFEIWARTAQLSISDDPNKMNKIVDEFEYWFKNSFVLMIGVPKWANGIISIIDAINLLRPIKSLLKSSLEKYIFTIVNLVTGTKFTNFDEAAKKLLYAFKEPKQYIDGGLFDNKKTSELLDKDFGNYGTTNDSCGQTFSAVMECLNMSKLCLIGSDNLNILLEKGPEELKNFYKETTIENNYVNYLQVNIKTSPDPWSGTDSNVFFRVHMKDGTTYERLFDKPGYNDFECNENDFYNFYFYRKISLEEIAGFSLRKEGSDVWKPWRVTIYDGSPKQRKLFSAILNFEVTTKKVDLNFNDYGAIPPNRFAFDPRIITFLHSLDGAGTDKANPTEYKQWDNKEFIFYSDLTLRTNVFKVLFPKQY